MYKRCPNTWVNSIRRLQIVLMGTILVILWGGKRLCNCGVEW